MFLLHCVLKNITSSVSCNYKFIFASTNSLNVESRKYKVKYQTTAVISKLVAKSEISVAETTSSRSGLRRTSSGRERPAVCRVTSRSSGCRGLTKDKPICFKCLPRTIKVAAQLWRHSSKPWLKIRSVRHLCFLPFVFL